MARPERGEGEPQQEKWEGQRGKETMSLQRSSKDKGLVYRKWQHQCQTCTESTPARKGLPGSPGSQSRCLVFLLKAKPLEFPHSRLSITIESHNLIHLVPKGQEGGEEHSYPSSLPTHGGWFLQIQRKLRRTLIRPKNVQAKLVCEPPKGETPPSKSL